MITAEFDVATFLDHLIFDWLQKSQFPSLLFTTQDMAFVRQAVVSGMAMPVNAIIRTSPPMIDQERYGKSVLKRTVLYNGEPCLAQIIDYTVRYSFFTASYLLQNINESYQRVLWLDSERYFDFDLSSVIPPKFNTRAEFKKAGQDLRSELSDDSGQRKFYITVDWELRITIPVLDSAYYLERVELYINDHPITAIGG